MQLIRSPRVESLYLLLLAPDHQSQPLSQLLHDPLSLRRVLLVLPPQSAYFPLRRPHLLVRLLLQPLLLCQEALHLRQVLPSLPLALLQSPLRDPGLLHQHRMLLRGCCQLLDKFCLLFLLGLKFGLFVNSL
jgi:hypothetical protein